jgi:hypothetical protein
MRLLDPAQLLGIVLASKWGAVGLHILKIGTESGTPSGGCGHTVISCEE